MRDWLIAAVLTVLVAAPVAQQADAGEWRQVSPGHQLRFPRDHASHPDYRIEWWYYTGQLEAADGRRLGYQLTFFRVGVNPVPASPSRWAVRDLHMAHFAVTDLAGERHLVTDRLNREGVGWAGASTERLDVWNDDWRATLDGNVHRLTAASRDPAFRIDLSLVADREPVLHGNGGFSQKGSSAGNASIYYSFTRMRTTGRLFLDDRWIEVTGSSWMDHEFGTSFLEPSQRGWDWFSLQFDDGTDLMVYGLRNRDGSRHAQSSGTLIRADGSIRHLDATMFTLVPGRRWTSPDSGASYPVEWQIDVPSAGLALQVRAALDRQELRTPQSTGVTYWEGVVTATGLRNGQAVAARGYLEMTGYAGEALSEVLR